VSYAGALRGRRILVTGASGFVGRRVVERLVLECGATVRVLVRSIGRAAPLSRLSVEIAVADLRDREATGAAVSGCDVVVHCARGIDGSVPDRRAVDVDGTLNLLQASAGAHVSRFVHTSTVVVYEIPRAGVLDESAPLGKGGDAYARAKRAAELLVLEQTRVPATVVQPTVVYGPHAGVYGREIIAELSTARIPLVDGGKGICNALYVDDLVTALLLAATSDRAPGERFLVSGPEHPSWAEFFGGFETMLGVRRTVPMAEADALSHWKRSARRTWLVPEAMRALRADAELRGRLLATREGILVSRVARRVLPPAYFAPERWNQAAAPAAETGPPLVAFRPDVIRFLAGTARVGSEKARTLLGYEPVFGLADGMRLTEAWARWEGLVPGVPAR
jgi:nucleoside-diphosphate-sugar epimerase